jgi:DNA-binding MarR family transcriptional regulator
MTHSTDKLIKLGLISRRAGTQDRREVLISLTPKGEEYLGKIDPIMRSRIESKLALLSEADMEKLAVSLRGVAEVFAKLKWD